MVCFVQKIMPLLRGNKHRLSRGKQMKKLICRKTSSKRAFTLIEMILAIAISFLFVSLIYANFFYVNTSHARVAVINDAKDFAWLNMEAISNLILNADSIVLSNAPISESAGVAYTSAFYDTSTSSTLRYGSGVDSKSAFNYVQYRTSDGKVKWRVSPSFKKDSNNSVLIQLDIIDNVTGTVYYTLTQTIYVSNISSPTGISYVDTDAEVKSICINYHNPDYIHIP